MSLPQKSLFSSWQRLFLTQDFSHPFGHTEHSHAHRFPHMMKRKRGNVGLGIDTAKRKRTPTINEIPNLEENHSFSKSISNQDIPLISIYFRLLETIEGHKVSSYTIPPYQQISMLSPQTPRNLRRLVLGKSFT